VPFSPEYIRLVLNQNFEDAKARLLAPLMAIHYAHLVMLVETKIVTAGDGRTLRRALDGLDLNATRDTSYDGQDEDLFFHVDRLIAGACGADLAGRLHTAAAATTWT
jgi:argininosuccinate lyase